MQVNLSVPTVQEIKQVKILKTAYNDKIAGNMELQELIEICINWSFYYALDGYKYREIQKPDFVKTYEVMFEDIKIKQWDKPEFKEKYLAWLDEESKIKHVNQSNRMWLRRMLAYYQYKQDQEKINKVQAMLDTYRKG